MKKWHISGKVNIFPGLSGWHWVGVPDDVVIKIKDKSPKGPWKFLPINVRLGNTEWKTALLPLGEGKFFIAIKAKVRKSEGVMLGDSVVLDIKI